MAGFGLSLLAPYASMALRQSLKDLILILGSLLLSEVKELTVQFPAATPIALKLNQFLAYRSLDQSHSGGLSSSLVEDELTCYLVFSNGL